MTTSILPPLLPNIGPTRAAVILECLEEEVRHCGATYGLLIDRAGQIIAADSPGDEFTHERMVALAVRLVPIFLTTRTLSRTFREWPVRATVEEGGDIRLLTQPILDQWLLAMAFPSAGELLPVGELSQRWLARLIPLVPDRATKNGRVEAGQVITRDNINLLFREDQDDKSRGDHEGEE